MPFSTAQARQRLQAKAHDKQLDPAGLQPELLGLSQGILLVGQQLFELVVKPSIGIALKPADATDVEGLLRAAWLKNEP